MTSKQQQAFGMCVRPCPGSNGWGYTHSLCCLFGRGACTVSDRGNWLWALRCASLADTPIPPGVLSQKGPSGSCSPGLQSWGSQMDLSAGLETGTALSLPLPDRSSASYKSWYARAAVSSAPIEAQTLQLSDSEDLDVVSAYTRDWRFATSVSCLWGACWGCSKSCWEIEYPLASRGGGLSFWRQTWWTLPAFSYTTSTPGIAIFPWSPCRGVKLVGETGFK